MAPMFGATLLCTDEGCAEVVDVLVGSLEELEELVCDGCGCCSQVLAVWEVAPARLPLRLVRGERSRLPRAA
jgi:hypothetical protein